MSTPTPSLTPGGTVAAATAGVTAKAEVVQKNSFRFSPRHMDHAHPQHAEGYTYAAIDVASGAVVKGFTNEDECNSWCQEQNAK